MEVQAHLLLSSWCSTESDCVSEAVLGRAYLAPARGLLLAPHESERRCSKTASTPLAHRLARVGDPREPLFPCPPSGKALGSV